MKELEVIDLMKERMIRSELTIVHSFEAKSNGDTFQIEGTKA